ncbi:unnamed protein product [Blepharisma stoltei]|uniref:Uncharacterized protein n=1 Tax=Blepharisma stoltei TaxID=1481888 RepID=A0AAU9IV34_9CILI|nr:unnamed protein product [Blepharisma stoltei]
MDEEVNYKSLYEEKYEELESFKKDFEEYQESNKRFELEVEEEIEQLMVAKLELERENKALQEKLEKAKGSLAKKTKELEAMSQRLKTTSSTTSGEIDALKQRLKEVETENEVLRGRVREKDQNIGDLTKFYHKTLEELSLAGSELERIKTTKEKESQKLKEHVSELTQELQIIRRPNLQAAELEQPPPEKDFKIKFDTNVQNKDPLDMIDSLILTISNSLDEYKSSYALK